MQRSRSLRKPSDRNPNPDPDSRTVSPSRLPVKPSQRPASSAAGPARQPSTRTGTARAPSSREEKKYPLPSSRTVSAAQGKGAPGRARAQTGGALPEGDGTRAKAAGSGSAPGRARTKSGAATTLRPPSQSSRAQPSAAASRQPSHTRTKSSTAALSSSSSVRGPSQPRPQSRAQAPAPARATRAPNLKPAFNNHQQHYSPARNLGPKPLTSTFLAPPSPGKLPANVAISAETLRLQNDLLRHHVLHASSAATTASWHESAREKLGGRFGDLARESRELSAEETRLLEDLNVAALRRWGGNLEEKVQGLDALLASVWRVSEPGGKQARLARRFERWAERAAEAEEARSRGGILDGDEPALAGGLDAAWREECEALKARLEGWRAQLKDLRYGPPGGEGDGSNLEGILAGCEELVSGMLSELSLMLDIEAGVVNKEREWVRGVIGSVGDESTGAGAIWRAA